MKRIGLSVFFCGLIFFGLGYFYAYSGILAGEFKKVSSDALVRIFSERVSILNLLYSGRNEDAKMVLETLVAGDLVLIDELDLIQSSNSSAYCPHLRKLSSSVGEEYFSIVDLNIMLEKCD